MFIAAQLEINQTLRAKLFEGRNRHLWLHFDGQLQKGNRRILTDLFDEPIQLSFCFLAQALQASAGAPPAPFPLLPGQIVRVQVSTPLRIPPSLERPCEDAPIAGSVRGIFLLAALAILHLEACPNWTPTLIERGANDVTQRSTEAGQTSVVS